MDIEQDIFDAVLEERAKKDWLTDFEVTEIINKVHETYGVPLVDYHEALEIIKKRIPHICGNFIKKCQDCKSDYSHWFLVWQGILASNERTHYDVFQVLSDIDMEQRYQNWMEKVLNDEEVGNIQFVPTGDERFRDNLFAEMEKRGLMSEEEFLDYINVERAKYKLPPVENAFEEARRVIGPLPHTCGEFLHQIGVIVCPDCGVYEKFWLRDTIIDGKRRWGVVLPIDLNQHSFFSKLDPEIDQDLLKRATEQSLSPAELMTIEGK